jgi:hypothetical protein
MVVSAHDKGGRHLQVLELWSSDLPLEEHPPTGDYAAQAFLEIALTSDVFMAAVFVGGRPRKSGAFRLVTDLAEAIQQRTTMESAMQTGLEVVFGVRMAVPALQAHFAAWGYREQGRGRFGIGDKYDPTVASWAPEAFVRAVELAAQHATTLCVFGHDWDPVHLLSAELAEPQSQP